MSKRLLFLTLFGGLCSPLLHAEPLSPADLKALLGRVREKRAAAPQVQADFQEEKTVRMLNKSIVSTGKIWFQAPNKFFQADGSVTDFLGNDWNANWGDALKK